MIVLSDEEQFLNVPCNSGLLYHVFTTNNHSLLSARSSTYFDDGGGGGVEGWDHYQHEKKSFIYIYICTYLPNNNTVRYETVSFHGVVIT
jgi:hypothetical protein